MSRFYLIVTCSCLLLVACSPRDLLYSGKEATAVVSAQNIPEVTPIPFPCQADLEPAMGDEVPYRPVLGVVMGCVTNKEGRPVAYAGVPVLSVPPGVEHLTIGHTTREDGRYWNDMLREPGRYQLGVYADGYRPAKKWVEVRKGRTAVLDFVLEPLPAATATALAIVPTPAPPVVWEFPCQSETRGSRMLQSDATYSPTMIETRDAAEAVIDLMGCIKDASGKGIAGATTVARDLETNAPRGIDMRTEVPVVGQIEYRTGENGRYIEPNIDGPGWWEVMATAPGYVPVTKRVLIPGGDTDRTAVLDFVLQPEK